MPNVDIYNKNKLNMNTEFKIPNFNEFLSEQRRFPRPEKRPKAYVTYKGDKYEYTLVKTFKGNKHESPDWGLIVTNLSTNESIAWPNVFSYKKGWSQGTARSVEEWYLQVKEFGGASNGSGQSKATEPRFIDDTIESIIEAYHGKSYIGQKNYYTINARTYDNEKISVIKSDLKSW